MTMTLQDYIKLAEAPHRTDQANQRLIAAVSAMAKALIEAEEALKYYAGKLNDDEVAKKALAQIQALQENKNDR